jgi:ribonuclease HI
MTVQQAWREIGIELACAVQCGNPAALSGKDATVREESSGVEHAQPGEGQALIVRTDGASRGNPGHAAVGVVVELSDGTVIAQGKRYLGITTNNQAEYRALILGLKTVTHYHPSRVTVFMDSELVVKQMLGQYKVRDAALESLWREARALAAALPAVTFTHVLRGKNARADRLANEALDEQAQSGA